MEGKGNKYLVTQLNSLVLGLTFWKDKGVEDKSKNPLLECDFHYLAFKLQVLNRLQHYFAIEAANQRQPKLFYMCSGSDEFCRILESIGFVVTTLDMYENEYSNNHIKVFLRDDEESLILLRDLVEQSDIVLWDSSIGHLDEEIVRKMFPLISGKVYVLGLYDVPKLELFGQKVRSHPMMANIIKNSPTTNPDLYCEILKKAKLKFSVDLGAFSMLLYDNIYDFPYNDTTMSRYLDQANSI